jgi:hypothetical protein
MIKALLNVAKAYLRDWRQFNELRRTQNKLRVLMKGVPLGDPERPGRTLQGDIVTDINVALKVIQHYDMSIMPEDDGRCSVHFGEADGYGYTLNEAVCYCLGASHALGLL